jgi:hypothetical protein
MVSTNNSFPVRRPGLVRNRFDCWLRAVLLIAVVAGGMCGMARAETIIVIRHGDRDGLVLNEEGKARCEWLGLLFKSTFARIDHIFWVFPGDKPDSDDDRLEKTAEGISNEILPGGPIPTDFVKGAKLSDWLVGFKKLDDSIHPGEDVNIVILHHPDIPGLVNSLTDGHPGIDKSEFNKPNEYDNIFILTRKTTKDPFTLLHLHFDPPVPSHPGQ